MEADDNYTKMANGIFCPRLPVTHREEQYDSQGFDVLWNMQCRHFWYRGRHRFLQCAFQRSCAAILGPAAAGLRVIDMGGGCGGWVKYLHDRAGASIGELALADSSIQALERAEKLVAPSVTRYQIDLLRLGWNDRWDVAFLLDVIEHIPDDAEVLRQIHTSLRPGGLLFITTPALQVFWSYNDEVAHHLRRYSRPDFVHLAETTGFELRDARYFMFFLSPLLWLSRRSVRSVDLSPGEMESLARKAHEIPPSLINGVLTAVFGAETPLGFWIPFPWGTSILGVFQKPW